MSQIQKIDAFRERYDDLLETENDYFVSSEYDVNISLNGAMSDYDQVIFEFESTDVNITIAIHLVALESEEMMSDLADFIFGFVGDLQRNVISLIN